METPTIDPPSILTGYAHPEVLVDTAWVHEHLGDPAVRLVEVDDRLECFQRGHIPGAAALDWRTQLQDPLERNIVGREQLEQILSALGIQADDTLVLYGDAHNCFAAYAFWVLKIYGHEEVRLLNGGRDKWIAEKRPLSTGNPLREKSNYDMKAVNPELRAFLRDVQKAVSTRIATTTTNLVDVRESEEFNGRMIAPSTLNEGAMRGGHIPGAKNIPWMSSIAADGTFKTAHELRQIYMEQGHIDPRKRSIVYCRIGERSSHTWFVLKYLLGLKHVKNYDGGWTEYGNLVGVPIEKRIA